MTRDELLAHCLGKPGAWHGRLRRSGFVAAAMALRH